MIWWIWNSSSFRLPVIEIFCKIPTFDAKCLYDTWTAVIFSINILRRVHLWIYNIYRHECVVYPRDSHLFNLWYCSTCHILVYFSAYIRHRISTPSALCLCVTLLLPPWTIKLGGPGYFWSNRILQVVF